MNVVLVYLLLLTYLTPFFSVSVVDMEQVNDCCVQKDLTEKK